MRAEFAGAPSKQARNIATAAHIRSSPLLGTAYVRSQLNTNPPLTGIS
jgi:hypothetical protein